jgi:putative transposase
MPVHKNHHNTPHPPTTSVSVSPSDVPSQESFHQHLRELIRGATRVVMEEIMQEEITLFLGAQWGESTSQRRGYRNGSYTRDLVTTSGRIEDVNVPRDREGQFHTKAFERYSRYEPQVAEAFTQMFVNGSSTHKIGKVANTLLGVAPSASSVSRLNESLSEQFEAWRTRPLQTHYRIVYLDGIHFSIRHGSQCDASIILTILGVDMEGNKEVLALRACAEESREGWLGILQDMRSRGATQVDLFVTDGHEGLLGALGELFTATPRQRCLVHKQRNILRAIPRREREQVQADLMGIWKQEKKEDAFANLAAFKAKYAERYPQAVRSLSEDEEHMLTFYDFPVGMHRHIQSTNAIEGFFSNVRQRTDQIDTFTTEASCVRLVWAVMQDIRFHKVTVS